MLIARAPMRISFFGGGTDYQNYFEQNTGAVLGVGIDSYVYVAGLPLPPVAVEKFRFTYRNSESVNDISDIQHPVVRATLQKLKWDIPINIATMADLPGNSGLGSSSAFTVALLKLLQRIQNQEILEIEIAKQAIEIERHILKESGGWQDQLFTSHGGLRAFSFGQGKQVHRLALGKASLNFLEPYFMLFPIGGARQSSTFASQFSESVASGINQRHLQEMTQQVHRVISMLQDVMLDEDSKVERFSKELRISWALKVKSNHTESLRRANEIIEESITLGAFAGKLCGAGGSGYIFLICPPTEKSRIATKLGVAHWTSPKISSSGVEVSQIMDSNNFLQNKWNSP